MFNEPAFPIVHPPVEGITMGGVEYSGMTLRDYFAAKVMQSFALDTQTRWTNGVTGMAKSAYQWADAMLEARKDA